MKAMVLTAPGTRLQMQEVAQPVPGPDQILIRVGACGVCRTDLHILDGDLDRPQLPLIPGHEIVGTVEAGGKQVDRFAIGDRVGVPWLGHTCGHCRFCRQQQENLCDQPGFTGYQINGGYAEFTVADARFCFKIPESYSDTAAAPLLCAGLIGHRALHLAGSCQRLGLYGFGAAAHIVIQVARFQQSEVYAFTRPGDHRGQEFARTLGAVWAGDSDSRAPQQLDAAIIFAPVGSLVPAALDTIRKGGTVVCAGIHMSDIPSFPYRLLWGERSIRSVANLTRSDGRRLFDIAPKVPVQTHTRTYPLESANDALSDLRNGRISGAAVLVP